MRQRESASNNKERHAIDLPSNSSAVITWLFQTNIQEIRREYQIRSLSPLASSQQTTIYLNHEMGCKELYLNRSQNDG